MSCIFQYISVDIHIDYINVAIGHVHYSQNGYFRPKIAILAIMDMANGNIDIVNMDIHWKILKNAAHWWKLDIHMTSL